MTNGYINTLIACCPSLSMDIQHFGTRTTILRLYSRPSYSMCRVYRFFDTLGVSIEFWTVWTIVVARLHKCEQLFM